MLAITFPLVGYVICTSPPLTTTLSLSPSAAATDVTLGHDGQHKTKYGILAYRTIACANCGSHLGRAHVGLIPDKLQQLHHAFAFDVEQCKSYLFGTSELGIDEDELTTSSRLVTRERPEAETTTIVRRGEGDGGDQMAALVGKMHELEEDLLKIQGLLVLHDQQLKHLPGYPGNQ
jgi:hypothetical protein